MTAKFDKNGKVPAIEIALKTDMRNNNTLQALTIRNYAAIEPNQNNENVTVLEHPFKGKQIKNQLDHFIRGIN